MEKTDELYYLADAAAAPDNDKYPYRLTITAEKNAQGRDVPTVRLLHRGLEAAEQSLKRLKAADPEENKHLEIRPAEPGSLPYRYGMFMEANSAKVWDRVSADDNLLPTAVANAVISSIAKVVDAWEQEQAEEFVKALGSLDGSESHAESKRDFSEVLVGDILRAAVSEFVRDYPTQSHRIATMVFRRMLDTILPDGQSETQAENTKEAD